MDREIWEKMSIEMMNNGEIMGCMEIMSRKYGVGQSGIMISKYGVGQSGNITWKYGVGQSGRDMSPGKMGSTSCIKYKFGLYKTSMIKKL